MEATNQMQTLERRLITWTAEEGIVGFAFNAIRDAVMRGHGNKMFFLDYDEFTQNPIEKLKSLYEFLNKPYYNHDINNVKQYTKENDAEHGFTDLHTIRSEIKPLHDDSQKILGYAWEQFKNFHYNF